MPDYTNSDLIDANGKTKVSLPESYNWSDYRAYVGLPEEYDLFSAMVFNLLTTLGLRQQHRVLDIGCGSLRIGRLLIPYLSRCNYYGVEPNQWLVNEGIQNEIGQDLVNIKQPTFSFKDSMVEFQTSLQLDYAVAQSIFSHCGRDLLENWLSQVAFHLKEQGALVATFLVDNKDYEGNGWIYPECVLYRPETVAQIAARVELDFEILDWAHPRQTWAIFSKKNYDKSLIQNGTLSWNRLVHQLINQKNSS